MEFTSKSVIVKKFGGYDVLEVTKFKLPDILGLIEVKVHYCGVNFCDLYTRQGMLMQKPPFVLGAECTGVVTAVGAKDADFKIGDRVICYNYLGGMYSDVVRVPPSQCYHLPDDISFENGAALFVNYLTAYFSLFSLGNLQADHTIFIPSCGGGVGWAATQLANTLPNVTIYGTASKNKEELVKKNGVHHVLSNENLDNNLETNFDLILDSQSGAVRSLLEKHLNPLGTLVMLGANSVITNEKQISPLNLIKMWWWGKSVSPLELTMNSRGIAGLHLGLLAEKEPKKIRNALSRLFDLLREEKISPKIDSFWKLEQIVDATKVIAERRNVGKVLLKVID